MVFTLITWSSPGLSTVGVSLAGTLSGHVGCPFSSPALTLARSFGCCTSSSMPISNISAVISRPFSQSCQKQLLWQGRVTGFSVRLRTSICICYGSINRLGRGEKKHSLWVEHAWANDKLEDILEGFKGSEYGLTLFSSAGHIQVPLQHRHQLPGKERWGKKSGRKCRTGEKKDNQNQSDRIVIPFLMYHRLES